MLVLALTAFGATCALEASSEAPFAVDIPTNISGVRLIPVVRLDDNREGATALLGQFRTRGHLVAISVRPGTHDSFVADLAEAGHPVIVRLTDDQLPVNAIRGPAFLRRLLKPLKKATGPIRAVEAPLGDAAKEQILHRVGLKAVLETNGAPNGRPRRQLKLEGQPNNGVILPAGPYAGDCGRSPLVAMLTPPALDRISQAIFGARTTGVTIVRATFPDTLDSAKVDVLGRWLDTVVRPAEVTISTPASAREDAHRWLKSTSSTADERASTGGRLVRVDQVEALAGQVAELERIPRQLPGDLTPTEAFQALARVAAGRVEGDVVRLAALDGPATLTAQLPKAVEIDPEAARTLAGQLIDALPQRIPAALSCDGQLLGASALLTLFASVVNGDEPATARSLAPPDPNAPGLGWGSSTQP